MASLALMVTAVLVVAGVALAAGARAAGAVALFQFDVGTIFFGRLRCCLLDGAGVFTGDYRREDLGVLELVESEGATCKFNLVDPAGWDRAHVFLCLFFVDGAKQDLIDVELPA